MRYCWPAATQTPVWLPAAYRAGAMQVCIHTSRKVGCNNYPADPPALHPFFPIPYIFTSHGLSVHPPSLSLAGYARSLSCAVFRIWTRYHPPLPPPSSQACCYLGPLLQRTSPWDGRLSNLEEDVRIHAALCENGEEDDPVSVHIRTISADRRRTRQFWFLATTANRRRNPS